MYLTKKSIFKGKSSIWKRLEKAGIENVEDYFVVLTLYKYEKLPESETIIVSPIYIHSKFILVDDKYMFIGSPNINDRSLMGDRDSEIGALLVDEKTTTIEINQRRREVSLFAHSVRKKLWGEHLGVDENELIDPIQTIEEVMIPMAECNSMIYERNFLFFPSDKYRRLESNGKHLYPIFTGDENDLRNIRGYFIKYPLRFGELEKQTLSIGNIIIE